jgi:hypothetical protein
MWKNVRVKNLRVNYEGLEHLRTYGQIKDYIFPTSWGPSVTNVDFKTWRWRILKLNNLKLRT